MMIEHDNESVVRYDLSARDECAVFWHIAFTNTANIGPRLASVRVPTRRASLLFASVFSLTRVTVRDPVRVIADSL